MYAHYGPALEVEHYSCLWVDHDSEELPTFDICSLQGSGGSEELLKWEESKKWQKTVEKMRTKIKERDAEIDRLQKSNKMLKDLNDR